ncbi:MAG: SagB/ThcOx family dehydrogenase [Anaerolineae bacterium]|nr:SagB/ThcOx family dehydrogenase [Anaerolineae bacterium]
MQGAGSKIIAGVLIMASMSLVACAPPVALPAPPTAVPSAAAVEAAGEVITLPAPRLQSDVSLEEALLRRRSVRTYSDQPLTLAEIGQLLWAAQGITDERGLRTAPSAGALYPLELYVATDDGLYHYRPQGHQAEVRRVEGWREALCPAALSQGAVCQAPAVFVVTAVYARTAAKYGERAERYVRLEAGHAAQNLLLQAVALDLGAVPIGAFYDDQVQAALGLPADHQPLYLIPVGRPAR